MALAGNVSSAIPGALGFDTAVPLNADSARNYFNQGYRFCVRYVSRTDASRAANAESGLTDISEAEGQLILASGLALMVVQHVAASGWVPSAGLGDEYGGNAAAYTAAAGLPEGVNVWLDLEDIPAGTSHSDIIDYCNAWFGKVSAAGYVPGVYVGFNSWLSPDELFFDLKTKHYWRAAGNIQNVSHRGYQMFQHVIKLNDNSELDKNVTNNDALGLAAQWLLPVSA